MAADRGTDETCRRHSPGGADGEPPGASSNVRHRFPLINAASARMEPPSARA
jgi:hypothetical protein